MIDRHESAQLMAHPIGRYFQLRRDAVIAARLRVGRAREYVAGMAQERLDRGKDPERPDAQAERRIRIRFRLVDWRGVGHLAEFVAGNLGCGFESGLVVGLRAGIRRSAQGRERPGITRGLRGSRDRP